MVRLTLSPHAHRRNMPVDIRPSYRRLHDGERVGDVTTPLRTVVDCLRDEPLRVAMSVGDSALRGGVVTHAELAAAVKALRGRNAAVARRRFALLDARAANAFESCARALLIEAGITGFVPQVSVSHNGVWIGRVDLAHLALRIVIECDGFETHGTLAAMTADATRHTWLVSAGWRPLRFTWHQVMFQPDWVLARVRDTIRLAGGAPLPDRRAEEAASAAA